MPGIVSEDDDVAGEQRAMRAAQVEQHAVFAGHGDHQHFSDDWRASAWIDHGRALLCCDIPGLNHFFPALRFADQEFPELWSVAADHVEANVIELLFDIGRTDGGGDFGFKFGPYIGRQALW